jgi:protein gp37
MAETSRIEWTDATWSPWEGCTKVSPGCDHCYAARMNGWLKKGENWGPGAPRLEYGDDHWKKPLKWNEAAAKAGEQLKVFPSVCDPFDTEAPSRLRQRFMSLIARTPNLTWLLLTKRVGNAKRMLSESCTHDGLLLTANDEYRPPKNLHIGATIVNREEMLRDAPKLKATPATLHFWSVEPMLGDLGEIPSELMPDWVIAGGESGPGARPAHPRWFRSLRDQCAAAGVPFLFKQWGEWAPHPPTPGFDEGGALRRGLVRYLQGDGREPDGHFRRGDVAVIRIGKGKAGRVLDGRTHDEFPEVKCS